MVTISANEAVKKLKDGLDLEIKEVSYHNNEYPIEIEGQLPGYFRSPNLGRIVDRANKEDIDVYLTVKLDYPWPGPFTFSSFSFAKEIYSAIYYPPKKYPHKERWDEIEKSLRRILPDDIIAKMMKFENICEKYEQVHSELAGLESKKEVGLLTSEGAEKITELKTKEEQLKNTLYEIQKRSRDAVDLMLEKLDVEEAKKDHRSFVHYASRKDGDIVLEIKGYPTDKECYTAKTKFHHIDFHIEWRSQLPGDVSYFDNHLSYFSEFPSSERVHLELPKRPGELDAELINGKRDVEIKIRSYVDEKNVNNLIKLILA